MGTAMTEQSVAAFAQGFNCAQSVLVPYAESCGVPREAALRLAAPFGGGMGCTGETCGAVTGALMALGMKTAGIDPQDAAAKQKNYERARQFIGEFKARNCGVLCRELIGCDISTAAGMQAARERKVFATLCPRLVQDAAEIVGKMLAQETPATNH